MTAAASDFQVLAGGSITSVPGFYAGAIPAGIKTLGESPLDLGLLYCERRCSVAGVFSTNRLKGGPLLLTMEHLESGHAQALVVNSGCANTYTGPEGLRDARRMVEAVATRLALPVREVLLGSTGVIGVRLPIDRVLAAIDQVQLARDRGHAFAQAITTTDTRTKEIAVECRLGEHTVRIAGVAKGAGMIHPNLATMFCFVVTDAAVDPGFIRPLLRRVADQSLNLVTVDGDMSPDDMMLLWSSGAAGNPPLADGTPEAAQFEQALLFVTRHLAREIARDGEGATRLLEVIVRGAASEEDARRAARGVVISPLVKTAIHGRDPNWGRIVSAVGQSGVRASIDRLGLSIAGYQLFAAGTPLDFDEAAVSEAMFTDAVTVEVDLGLGDGTATAWGCDLSVEYVRFNSDYTT